MEQPNGNGHGHTQPDLTYTSAMDYPGFKAPERHELPSGAVFLLRKPQVVKMMQRGQIPNPLMDVINDIFETRDQRELQAEAEAKGVTTDELLEERAREAEAAAEDPQKAPPLPQELEDELTPASILSFRDVVVWASIVAPTVEMAPPVNGTPLTMSGALSYDALDEDDIAYILRFANGEVSTTATFPADVERPGTRSSSGEMVDETVDVAGHPA